MSANELAQAIAAKTKTARKNAGTAKAADYTKALSDNLVKHANKMAPVTAAKKPAVKKTKTASLSGAPAGGIAGAFQAAVASKVNEALVKSIQNAAVKPGAQPPKTPNSGISGAFATDRPSHSALTTQARDINTRNLQQAIVDHAEKKEGTKLGTEHKKLIGKAVKGMVKEAADQVKVSKEQLEVALAKQKAAFQEHQRLQKSVQGSVYTKDGATAIGFRRLTARQAIQVTQAEFSRLVGSVAGLVTRVAEYGLTPTGRMAADATLTKAIEREQQSAIKILASKVEKFKPTIKDRFSNIILDTENGTAVVTYVIVDEVKKVLRIVSVDVSVAGRTGGFTHQYLNGTRARGLTIEKQVRARLSL